MFDSVEVSRYIFYPHGELCKKIKYALSHAEINKAHFVWKPLSVSRGASNADMAYGYDITHVGLYILLTMFRRQDFREKLQEYISIAERSGAATE